MKPVIGSIFLFLILLFVFCPTIGYWFSDTDDYWDCVLAGLGTVIAAVLSVLIVWGSIAFLVWCFS